MERVTIQAAGQTLSRVVLLVALAACGRGAAGGNPALSAPLDSLKAIAEDGFVYGLPIVMNYAVMSDFVLNKNSGQWKAPLNQIANNHAVFTWQDTAVITPNSDTPYSLLWLDLRAEPVVLSVPAVDPKRYYSVMLNDGNTFNYGYIGSRATGSGAGDYLIAGPGWQGQAPAGIKQVFHATTDFSLVIFRTQLLNAADMPNVIAVQDGYKAQPLSAWLKQPAPPAPAEVTWPAIDKEKVKTDFFNYLAFSLQFAPAGPEEEAIRSRLASIGIVPGKSWYLDSLPADRKAAVLLGMKEGEGRVTKAAAAMGKEINGWRVGSAFGDRAFYHGDWLLRAAAAKAGIYGNNAEEAMYPMTRTLPDGTPLDGSKHSYTLTFAKGQLPPVNAFWSVTMYDGKTQFLIKNPIDRYLINSPMLPGMKTNPDGSLTLYIQKDSPGKAKESNWLPAPAGPIYLVLRLYWPRPEAPSILPPGEGSWQPPALVQAQ
jgi:hypothetical protein